MSTFSPFSFVPTLLALQFAVFGWRIAREIALGDQKRRTWLLLSDFINLASMIAVVTFCVVIPLQKGAFPVISRVTLGAAYVLISFTPLIIAGHYRLFSKEGRSIYISQGRDYPWLTDQETVVTVLAVLSSVGAAFAIANG